jgi:hypothetical protein
MSEAAPISLFISYSHKDEKLRQSLDDHLAALQRQGVIQPWHDRKIMAGQEWAGAIDENLATADIILMLVSAPFLASDYCSNIEMRRALERHDRGEARVIPVILQPADWRSTQLGRLQALPANAKAVTTWSNRQEAFLSIAQGIREVAEAMRRARSSVPSGGSPVPAGLPTPASDPPPAVSNPAAISLEMPEGPVRHDSPFYIHPAQENRCFEEIEKPGALIRIKSPKGMGKSSLTARLLAHAATKGYRTAALNLEEANQKFFEDPDRFMQWFCAAVGKGLGLRIKTEDYWDDIFGANDNSRDYFEKYLLKSDSPPLVLAIDNFDRVFAHGAIETDFCGLLRSWHELARNNVLWEQFRLIIAHAQEPYLPKDINQSPFNVGLPVELGEFSVDQVRELVRRHGLKLKDGQVDQLIDLVGGHPYLVRTALYQLANGLSFEEYLRTAATDDGLYGNHLLGLLTGLEPYPQLIAALHTVMTADKPVSLRSEEAFKLDSLGLAVRVENKVKPRCQLYQRYILERLPC